VRLIPHPDPITVTQAKTHGHGIAEYCRSVDADLVVLGNRGRTTLKYILLGSTAERLLKEIPCSMLVVRPPVSAAETGPVSNSGETHAAFPAAYTLPLA
jgi:nucleotide-binding universal stress UspA family protein